MAGPILDPSWPVGARPDPGRAEEAGRGVGGRRYLRLEAAGPWGGSLFVKAFGPGLRGRPAAEQEFRAAQRLREAGAPSPRPWGVWDVEGEAWLLLQDCGPACTVAREAALERPGGLENLAAAAAALHAAGARHGDLHLGNLLRAPDGALLWTDLRRLEFPQQFGEPARAADLGRLAADLEPLTGRDLLRFVHAYQAALGREPASPAGARAFARLVRAAGEQRIRDHACNLDRRARRERTGMHPEIWREPALRAERERFEAATRLVQRGGWGARPAPDVELLKHASRSTVVRLTLSPGRTVVVKHFGLHRPLDPRNRMGRSKAIVNLLAAEGLLRRGMPAPRPLAAWSRSGAGAWLVLEDLPRHLPLQRCIVDLDDQDRQEVLRELARRVRRLHQLGVYHRDLKPSNVLVDVEAPYGSRIAFIDHDRNRFSREAVPRELARRDVAAVHAGIPPDVRASERIRALRAYDPAWCRPDVWRRHVRPLLEEAAERRHRWVPRALLSGARAPTEIR